MIYHLLITFNFKVGYLLIDRFKLLTLYIFQLSERMSTIVDETDIPQGQLQKIFYKSDFKFLASVNLIILLINH
jgi:hypothetical protein